MIRDTSLQKALPMVKLCQVAAVLATLIAGTASADIFQWEYVDPDNPHLGKQLSAMLAPDGSGITAGPQMSILQKDLTQSYLFRADFSNSNLHGTILQDAFLSEANLSGVRLTQADLTNADLSLADLTDAELDGALLGGADLAGAIVLNADLLQTTSTGFTAAALYSTASYQAGELGRLNLGANDLSGWNFADQRMAGTQMDRADLSGAIFDNADLTGTQISEATFNGASFRNTNLTSAKLFRENLSNVDFSGANLTGAELGYSVVTDANFTDATIAGADISGLSDGGFALADLYSTRSYVTGQLQGIEFEDNSFPEANFAGKDLSRSSFRNGSLANSTWHGAQMQDASITRTILIGADFSSANLSGTTISTDLLGVRFDGANLTNTGFGSSDLSGASFVGAIVRGARFFNVDNTTLTPVQLYSTSSYQMQDLREIELKADFDSSWSFEGQNLTGAVFGRYSSFDNVNWSGADLTDAWFVDVDASGADFSSSLSLRGINFDGSELSNSSFLGRDLAGSTFRNANLSDADFGGADLRDAILWGANLSGAKFVGANLQGAGLRAATDHGFVEEMLVSTLSYEQRDLRGIDLSQSDLTGWNLSDQDLAGADFENAVLMATNFSGATINYVNLTNSTSLGFTEEQLYSTRSYKNGDLSGVILSGDLANWDFTGQNLSSSTIGGNLTGAIFTDANIDYAKLGFGDSPNFSEEQLASTQNYKRMDLRSLVRIYGSMDGWDLQHQNLSNLNAGDSLANANVGGADLRGAFAVSSGRGVETVRLLALAGSNTIEATGIVRGLRLSEHDKFYVRDYDGPTYDFATPIELQINDEFDMSQGGKLIVVFEDSDWNSTIAFEPGIAVNLGGLLELSIDSRTDPDSMVGQTFQVFDWRGVTPIGRLIVESHEQLLWDTSDIYEGGTVTLLAVVPEPSSALLIAGVAAILCVFHRARRWDSNPLSA